MGARIFPGTAFWKSLLTRRFFFGIFGAQRDHRSAQPFRKPQHPHGWGFKACLLVFHPSPSRLFSSDTTEIF
jgi:hypothetical protein